MILPSSNRSRADTDVSEGGVYIGLGSNLGFDHLAPRDVLAEAMSRLEAGGDHIIARSHFWSSLAWPRNDAAPDYINVVCQVKPYDIDPKSFLLRLHSIEHLLGRRRITGFQWSNRTLDLDVLDYNGLQNENDSFLILPHPRLMDRDFVLAPLLEVAPKWRHPVTGITARDALAQLEAAGQTNACRRII